MRWVVTVVALVAAGCSFDPGGDPGGDGTSPGAPDAGETPASPDATPVTYLFADGYENGVMPAWTGKLEEPGDSGDPSQLQPFAGAFSLRSTTDDNGFGQAATYIDPGPHNELRSRHHLFLADGFANTDYVGLIVFSELNGSGGTILSVELAGNGELRTFNAPASNLEQSGVTLTTGTWYTIDAHLRIGADGGYSVSVDGVEVISVDENTGTDPIDRVAFGIVWQGTGDEPLELFTDDVIVHDGPI